MKERSTRRTRTVLLLGLMAAVALATGLYYALEDNPLRTPALSFWVKFDDVTGLHERARVTFLGIPAGFVQRFDYVRGERAVRVRVVITQPLAIPADVKASLEPTLLGESSLSLRLPEDRKVAGSEVALLKSESEVAGQRFTKMEAVVPGFDEALDQTRRLLATSGDRINRIGDIVNQEIDVLHTLFVEKKSDGRTEIENATASLQRIIDGGDGQASSVKSQLQMIVNNLQDGTENFKRFAQIAGNQEGSLSKLLANWEQVTRRLNEDAGEASKVLSKVGSASDAVIKAGEQFRVLSSKTETALDEFNKHPLRSLIFSKPATPEPARTTRGRNSGQ